MFNFTLLSNSKFSSLLFAFSAKGRTNVELRENFILASGVSQSMAGFVSKSPGSSASGSSRSGSIASGSRSTGKVWTSFLLPTVTVHIQCTMADIE